MKAMYGLLSVRVRGGREVRRGLHWVDFGTWVTPGRVRSWKRADGRVWRGWQHEAYVDRVLVDTCGIVHRGEGPKRCALFPSLVRTVREVQVHRDMLPGL